MIKRKCKVCHESFHVRPYKIKEGNGKYCSRECYWSSLEKFKYIKCETCGKRFKARTLEVKKWGRKYCCQKCMGIGGRRRKTVKCDNCNKSIWINLYKIKKDKNHFCSNKCKSQYKMAGEYRRCKVCRKPFYATYGLIKKNMGKFCSISCSGEFSKINKLYVGRKNPAWLGGTSFEPYGQEFNDELREMIRIRDNLTCQGCGLKQCKLKGMHRKLDIHHIDYNKKNNKPSNLISLCKSCHMKTGFKRLDWTKHFKSIIAKKSS